MLNVNLERIGLFWPVLYWLNFQQMIRVTEAHTVNHHDEPFHQNS